MLPYPEIRTQAQCSHLALRYLEVRISGAVCKIQELQLIILFSCFSQVGVT